MAFLISGGGGGGGGGGSSDATSGLLTNAAGADCVAGSPIFNVSSGNFGLAVATNAVSALVIGLLSADCAAGAKGSFARVSVLTLTKAQWVSRTGTDGLVPLATYYLDVVSGRISTSPPSSGNYSVRLGQALSPVDLDLNIQLPIGPLP